MGGVGHVGRRRRGGGRPLTPRAPLPHPSPPEGRAPRWPDPRDEAWLERWFADGSGLWDLLALLFYLPVILGSLLYLFQVAGGAYGVRERLLGDPERFGAQAGVGVALGLGLVGLSRLGELSGPGARARDLLIQHMGHVTWVGLALVPVVSALGEELLFRGILQPLTSLYVAAILFAAAHLPFRATLWPWTLQALLHGLVFGALMLPDDSALLTPIAAHATFNGVQLLRWKLRRARAG